MFYLCECAHLRFVADMAEKVRSILVNRPGSVSPPSEDKKPTTMKMNQKIPAMRP